MFHCIIIIVGGLTLCVRARWRLRHKLYTVHISGALQRNWRCYYYTIRYDTIRYIICTEKL